MKHGQRPNPLFLVMVLLGLVCSCVLLFFRAAAEHASRQTACAICWEDVELLARTDGRAAEAWLADLSAMGVHYLALSDSDPAQAEIAARALGMETARIGNTAHTGDAFLLPPPPARGFKGYPVPAAPEGDSSVPLALVENYDRTGTVLPDSFDPDAWDGPMVKTMYMYDAYSYHYEKHGTDPSENENILFRGVTDRSMRLIVLTPLEREGGGVVADPEAYRDLLSGLSARLERRGIVLGETFSAADAPRLNPFLLAGASLLAAALAVWLLCRFVPIVPVLETVLLSAGAAVAVGGAFLLPGFLQKLVAFGAAALTPCFTALMLAAVCDGRDKHLAQIPLALQFPALLAAELAVSLAGGLYVGSILASRSYLLEFDVFTGVKLAHLLPLAVTAAVLFLTLRRRRSGLEEPVPVAFVIFMVVCVAAALVLMVLRSGDEMLPVSDLETAVRTWLEQTLYARPRSKEMLMAFPVLALFLAAARRRIAVLELSFGVLAAVGSVSVVNTFCHIYTPLRVSLIRTLLSAGIGVVLGLAGLAVFCLLLRRRRR